MHRSPDPRWTVTASVVADVRAAEEQVMAQLPTGALMQRAAAGLAAEVVEVLETTTGGVYGREVVLLVGPGNNGGDALWAGARLAARGARVQALLAASTAHSEGLAALRAAGGRSRHVPDGDAADELWTAHLVVDGLLGIGGRPGLRGAAAELGERASSLPSDVPVVAVDLPSGVDPDTGETPGPHVRATHTVTFGVLKPCLLLPPGRVAAGEVRLVDIGLPSTDPAVMTTGSAGLAARWPVPGSDDDKYSRGVVGVVAGGPTYTGAAVLCSGAAVRTGAGMVRYVGPDEPTDLVRARWPEVVPGEGRVQAWVLGPGLDPEHDVGQRAAVQRALASDLPCVVDAGALTLLPERRDAPTLLTPHAGELARLLSDGDDKVERGDVEASPLRHARRAAELTGATVLLKGSTTLVVDADRIVRAQDDGPHWLATAGSGDVLAGVLGTLLAAGLPTHVAGEVGVAVHGIAGAIASSGGPASAGSVLEALPAAVTTLLTGARRAGRGAPIGVRGHRLREWHA
ncbi:MAG TPA: NAD(P)H-hydrate epimerase [Actinomycetales bacterium]|nr:NAD(P)H-hydrate epimerase [Actinomycetales bacterium]